MNRILRMLIFLFYSPVDRLLSLQRQIAKREEAISSLRRLRSFREEIHFGINFSETTLEQKAAEVSDAIDDFLPWQDSMISFQYRIKAIKAKLALEKISRTEYQEEVAREWTSSIDLALVLLEEQTKSLNERRSQWNFVCL